MQAKIQTGGGAGRGQYLAVVDKKNLGINVNLWIGLLQCGGGSPMRGGTASVKQSRLSQHESACADRRDPGPSLSSTLQRLYDARTDGGLRLLYPRYDHSVSPIERSEVMAYFQRVWARIKLLLFGADAHLIQRFAFFPCCHAKRFAGGSQIKWQYSGQGQTDKLVQGWSSRHGDMVRDGLKQSNIVILANRLLFALFETMQA